VRDPKTVYSDIIDLPHHISPVRKHMSISDRAAQFSSYKALSGYEDMIFEEARLVEEETHLEEDDLEKLDRKLNIISDMTEKGVVPVAAFTVFEQDDKKEGGRYVNITDEVKKVDRVYQKVILKSTAGRSGMNRTLDIKTIIDIVLLNPPSGV